MKADSASHTAAAVAAARGLGARLPPEAQLAPDPYGLAFSYPRLGKALSTGPLAHALLWAAPLRRWILYMQVRTRVLDDALRAFAAAGGEQLVLLGAGYDCRAHRLALELPGVQVLEVDHPATARRKRKVLARVTSERRTSELWSHPGVRYLAWDFEAQPMAELPSALRAAGLRTGAPTLTIWEGVTMYLSEPAIAATLGAVRDYSGAGSRLAFTYFDRGHVEGRGPLPSRLARAAVAQLGEPWRWGWRPSELSGYLAQHGLALREDQSMPEAAARLLPGRWARELEEPAHPHRQLLGYERVALATIG